MEELIYVKETPGRGLGVFAVRDIAKDEIIAEFKGPSVRIERMEGIPREVWDHLLNVDAHEYLIVRDPAARTNHSCDPNAGIIRNVFLAAMRDIKKDEEITFDYSITIADDWKIECACGSPSCRKTIGKYRDLPDELKKKYDKYTPDWVKQTWTVSRYLLHRLQEAGIGHLFGVPGDYVLDFLDEVVASPIKWVGTCNELNAGYAADGYARLTGAGAAVVTYCVGGFSILNAVAGAYAERVPLIVISGAPPARRREAGALVHHLVSDYYLQLDVFKKVTIDAAILTNPETAPDEIDRVIGSGILHKLPVYLELPADMAHAPCRPPAPLALAAKLRTDKANLKQALQAAAELLNQAQSPIVLAGVEVLRFGLGSAVLQLVEGIELPFATMLSSKCVLPELHPQFIGIYQGGWSRKAVSQQVESSDCLLSLGVWMTDMDTGMFSGNLDNRRMIAAGGGQVCIGGRCYRDIRLGDFIGGLMTAVRPRSYTTSHPVESYHAKTPFVPEPSRKLTALRLYERLNTFLDDRMILLAEAGDAFCAAPDFHIEEAENFIVQAFYTSIGYCTPAALGAALARPGKRPVVLTGDGAFQMTAQELSTLIRQRCPAVILIINNDGYLVERLLHQDGPYNDIQMWNYAELPAALNGGAQAVGIRVTTEGELEQALQSAAAGQDKLFLIELCLPDRDCSTGLKKLGDAFRKKS